jgi:plastocyanin
MFSKSYTLVCSLCAMLLAQPARATDMMLTFQDETGKPVGDVVVTLYPNGKPAALPASRPEATIIQRNLKFDPFVLTVPVGTKVNFPNLDRVRHQVYSFSDAKRFSLELYGQNESRAVVFDQQGVAALGCSIHDAMVAFVKVVDTGLYESAKADGVVSFKNLPTGPLTVKVWHPYQNTPGAEQVVNLVIPERGSVQQTVKISLRAMRKRGS